MQPVLAGCGVAYGAGMWMGLPCRSWYLPLLTCDVRPTTFKIPGHRVLMLRAAWP